MKALFYNFLQKKFILKEIPLPGIKPNEALVRIKVSSLCGSDLHIIDGSLTPKVYNKKEIILGHSFSGVVAKTGKKIGNFKKGDRVFASNFVWCGKCQRCKEKKENLCNNRYIFGMEIPGANAEYISVPERALFHLPSKIDFQEGALITDLLALDVHALEKANLQSNWKIAILGAGPVGLTLGMLLRRRGIKSIFITEPVKYRQDLAKKFFAPELLTKPKNNFDIVFETSGKEKVFEEGWKLLKRGGKIILIGVPDKKFGLNSLKIISRELSILGVFNLNSRNIKESITLIKENKISLRDLITHRFDLTEAEKAYRLLKNRKAGRIIFTI